MLPLHRTRKPLRLPDYDYSQPGSYFVTIMIQSNEGFVNLGVLGTDPTARII
jgi:hypothetical protein